MRGCACSSLRPSLALKKNVFCNPEEVDTSLAVWLTQFGIPVETQGLCVHIRRQKWYFLSDSECPCPNHQCDGIWRWGFGELSGVRWGHEGGFQDGICVIMRRDTLLSFLPPSTSTHKERPREDTQLKGRHLQAGKGALTRNWIGPHLACTSSLQTARSKFLW